MACTASLREPLEPRFTCNDRGMRFMGTGHFHKDGIAAKVCKQAPVAPVAPVAPANAEFQAQTKSKSSPKVPKSG